MKANKASPQRIELESRPGLPACSCLFLYKKVLQGPYYDTYRVCLTSPAQYSMALIVRVSNDTEISHKLLKLPHVGTYGTQNDRPFGVSRVGAT